MLKILQFVCYILHMICVYKIQTTQNPTFLSVYIFFIDFIKYGENINILSHFNMKEFNSHLKREI